MAMILTDKERENVKYMLRVTFNDAQLRAQRQQALEKKAVEAGDHQSQVLGLFAGLIDEILGENARPAPRAAATPDLAALKRKYLGPQG